MYMHVCMYVSLKIHTSSPPPPRYIYAIHDNNYMTAIVMISVSAEQENSLMELPVPPLIYDIS